MIGAAVSGGVAWAMVGTSIGLVFRGCDDESDGCLGLIDDLSIPTGIRWIANGSALGLAIPAGVLRGRYDATKEARDGRPSRNIGAIIRGGQVAIGMGAVSWVALKVGLAVFLTHGEADLAWANALFAGQQVSFAVASTGAGLLAYGKAHRERARSVAGSAQVRVVPYLSREHGGLSLAGRF